MARNTVPEWDTNPDLNTDIAGVNIAEGCPPSGINDAIRRIMAQLATLPVGFRNIPARSVTAVTGIAISDAGRKIKTTANVTVPTNATAAFPIDDLVVIVNMGATAITITPESGVTLKLAGTNVVGLRTLAPVGRAVLSKEATNEWHITGVGLS